MGLDLLDVTFRIEKEFQITMPKEEFLGLVRSQDIIVGDLYEYVLNKLHLRDLGRNSVRVNEYLWSEMRLVLQAATGESIKETDLSLALDVVFPSDLRRSRWDALRAVCPYKLRELDYPRFVRIFGLLIAAGVVAIEQGRIWQIPGAIWFWPLLGLFAIWMVSETYVKVLSFCAPLRNRFPSGMTTVKDLCRNVMSTNYADICSGSEIALDQRCSVIWEKLVEILASALGVDPDAVTFRSRLFADLGAE